MAIKQFYHDIDLVNVGQLVGARLQNVSSSAMATLGEQLGAANKGLTVYNTTDNRIYVFNGAGFDPFQIDVAGDIKFRGVINAGNAANVEKVSGYQYVVDAAGTLSVSGVTFFPNAEVEVGDQVLFTSETEAYVLQRNDVQATETTLGNVSLASQAEANAGVNDTDAITPKTLHGYVNPEFAADRLRLEEIEAKNREQDGRIDALEAEQILSFFATVNLAAATPFTVSHGLNLMNKDSFVVRTALGGSDISLDVDSVNVNSLTLTSLVPLNGVSVFVVGR